MEYLKAVVSNEDVDVIIAAPGVIVVFRAGYLHMVFTVYPEGRPTRRDGNPVKPRGVYMGHSEPKDTMPESTGEYFFLCKNLRQEAASCLPQALNIAFGEDVFSTKQIFAESLTSSYGVLFARNFHLALFNSLQIMNVQVSW